jgi:hypothetical protein
MTNQFDPQTQQVANQVGADGAQRFGHDHFSQAIAAIGKALPNTPGEQVLREALATGDAAGTLYSAGKHALINRASAGDAEAERLYSEMRRAERDHYRKMKGR